MVEFYGDEVQEVKDVVEGSVFEVGSQWSGILYSEVQRSFLQNAGVLFADAGRSRNPYSRTMEDQRRIADFTHEMMYKYLRIFVTIKPEA